MDFGSHCQMSSFVRVVSVTRVTGSAQDDSSTMPLPGPLKLRYFVLAIPSTPNPTCSDNGEEPTPPVVTPSGRMPLGPGTNKSRFAQS